VQLVELLNLLGVENQSEHFGGMVEVAVFCRLENSGEKGGGDSLLCGEVLATPGEHVSPQFENISISHHKVRVGLQK